MTTIKSRFETRFADFGIELPESALTAKASGLITHRGWHIRYRVDEDDGGLFLEYYAVHRMMIGHEHEVLYANGNQKSLPSLPVTDPWADEDGQYITGDALRAYTDRVYKELEDKGLLQ